MAAELHHDPEKQALPEEPADAVSDLDDDDDELALDLSVADADVEPPSLVLGRETVLAMAPRHVDNGMYADMIATVSTRIYELKTRHGIHLLVDGCERFLAPFFIHQPWVTVKRIPTCDFLFVHKSGRPLCGFERKAQADLRSSVMGSNEDKKDKRFALQKEKMKCLEADRIGVILEGADLRERMFELNCECKTMIEDRMMWVKTNSLLDTVLFMYRYALGMFEIGQDFGTVRRLSPFETFQSVHKSVTPEVLLVHMLSCVPSFSSAKAKALAEHYSSMTDLTARFDLDAVAQIEYNPKGANKKRRIGPASATKVYKALFNSEPPEKTKKVKSKKRARKN